MRTPAPELKFTALDLKRVDAAGTFAGYASLFNKEDMGHDIVLPGAFRESLEMRGASGIKMLFQHNPASPSACGISSRRMPAASTSAAD